MGDTASIQAVREAFIAAPLTDDGWNRALKDMARLTRSARGQLVAFDGRPIFAMEVITDLEDSSFQDRFAEINGGDPEVNWRVRCSGAPLELITEHHYAEARRRRRFDLYDDFIQGADMALGSQTVLVQEKGSFFGLATLRTRSDGASSDDDLAAFSAVMSAAQTGVRLQRTLAHRGADLISGALEAMDSAVVLLDRRARIVACTAPAEAMLADQRHVRAKGGRLSALSPDADRALQAAIDRALGSARPPLPELVWLRSSDPDAPGRACEIFTLPGRDWNFGELPHVLVSLRRAPRFDARHKALLCSAMGLTAGEAEVALMMGRGLTREAIARERGVSIQTVAAQAKQIYRKAEVHNSGALIALLQDML